MRCAALTLHEQGWESAIIVTSPYRLARSLMLAEQVGVNVVGHAKAPNQMDLVERVNAILHEFGAPLVYYVTPVE